MALTDNLISWWKVDSNANDSLGTNNGTATNISYVGGKIGNAASFNGSSSNISIPSSASLNITGNEISFSFWIYPTAALNNNGILFKGAGSSQGVYSMGFFSGADMKMYMRLNGSTTTGSGQVISSGVVSQSVWTHVAGTYNGSTQKIYINGTEVGSQSYSTSLTSNTDALILGYYFSQSFDFQGYMDEIGIWNRGLSASEVTELYNGGAGITYPFYTFVPKIMIF